MPKEKLNYERTERRSEASQLSGIGDHIEAAGWDEMQPLVRAHWNPDNYVQLSIEIDKSMVERSLKEQADDPHVTFWSVPMERGEIQNAVKVLRRARNQVFGADE
jgi:hypothetical protein